MTSSNGGRKTLVALTTLAMIASALALGEPAQAEPEYTGPMVVECKYRPNTGHIETIVPAGLGKIRVTGTVRPCRKPGPRDAAVVVWDGGELEDAGVVYYRSGRHFRQIVQVPTFVDRVCLAGAPDKAMDCYAIRVPKLPGGKPGVPLVGGRTTTKDFGMSRPRPWCGACW